MPRIVRPISAGMAMVAALSLGTPQAFALDVSTPSKLPAHIHADGEQTSEYHRYRRKRRGIGAGGVIAGVVVLGAIAAIASASSRDRDRVRRIPTRGNVRFRDEERFNSRGIDRAVDICIDQVERGDERVGSVDNASRGVDGWRIDGFLDDGEPWNCWIDNDGRVRQIDFGSRFSESSSPSSAENSVRFESAAAAGAGQPQLSDAAYARARSNHGGDSDASSSAFRSAQGEPIDALPAYPGGPVAGDEFPGGDWVDDGRFDRAAIDGDLARR